VALVSEAVLEQVRAVLVRTGAAPTESAVAAALREVGVVLGQEAVMTLARRLRADLVGAGPLESLLAEPGVSDIVVNGPREVYIDRGAGLEPTGVVFADVTEVRRLAVRLATACGRRLDDAAPWVDATLPDGTRVHAVLPPIAPDGPLVSLRVLGRRSLSIADLVACGTVAADAEPMIARLVANRLSFLVTGGTGAGKTTVLSALLSTVPPRERLVVVEDTRELTPRHPHVVRLLARPPNVEGTGAVGLDDLVRQALRMRPDRLVVGEVRGAEVVDMLAALNTGHDGGCATVHANSSRDLPARLEALGVAAGLDRAAVHSQAAAGLQVVVHLARGRSRRRLAELAVLSRRGSELEVLAGYAWDSAGHRHRGPAASALEDLLGERA
jgi:pilus assembly protein CpaF